MQMEDYSMILRTMRAANCSDISDFNTLSGAVGDEELDGAKILEQQNLDLALVQGLLYEAWCCFAN